MYETEKNKDMDGIVETPGRIIFFTANHPERLDKALLRYGQIDHIIHFKKTNKLIIAQILQHFLARISTTETKKVKNLSTSEKN